MLEGGPLDSQIPRPRGKTLGLLLAVGLLLVVGLLVLLAPLFQPFVYGLVRESPVLVLFMLPTLVVGILVAVGTTYAGYDMVSYYTTIATVALLLFAIVVTAPLSGVVSSEMLGERTADKMDVQTLGQNNSLPQIDADNLRNVPRKKARVDAQNNFQKSKFKLSEEADITYVNGEPYWSYALVPDSGGERWSGYQNGSVYVSQTDSDGDVFIVEGDVKNGLGVQPWRSNLWNLQRHNYWVKYKEPFMTVTDLPNSSGTITGETKVARPYVTHQYQITTVPLAAGISLLLAGILFVVLWYFDIPPANPKPYPTAAILAGAAIVSVLFVPYALPTFGGVALQDADGNVEYIPPDEIPDHPELGDDNVYPYDLAKEEVQSLNWRDGVINYFWEKDGLFRFGEPDEDYGNSLPYTVQGADGSKDYYLPVSPQGGGDGLKHIFVTDGQTGEITQYRAGNTRMVGSQNVGKYVQSQTPPQVTTWEEYQPVEPLPVVHDEQLYWQVRILPTDGTGMPGYAFINASQTDDIVFAMGENKDQLARQFALGEDISDDTDVTQDRTVVRSGNRTVTQIVIRKDGRVVGRYNVTEDTSVEFTQIRVENGTAVETPG